MPRRYVTYVVKLVRTVGQGFYGRATFRTYTNEIFTTARGNFTDEEYKPYKYKFCAMRFKIRDAKLYPDKIVPISPEVEAIIKAANDDIRFNQGGKISEEKKITIVLCTA